MPPQKRTFKNRVYDPTDLYEPDDRIFRLVISSGNFLVLELVDAGGRRRNAGNILAIDDEGYLARYGGISRMVGLKLNRSGKVITREEFTKSG